MSDTTQIRSTVADAGRNQMRGTIQHMAAVYRRLADDLDLLAAGLDGLAHRDDRGRVVAAPHADLAQEVISKVARAAAASGADLIHPAALADIDEATREPQ